MAHTTGPWQTGAIMTRVEVWPEGWRVGMCIADCHAKHAPAEESERVANARLIAAAPDLLVACQLASIAMGTFPQFSDVKTILLDAIAKAKGGGA